MFVLSYFVFFFPSLSAAGFEPVALSSSLPETQHLSMALPDEDMSDDACADDDAGTAEAINQVRDEKFVKLALRYSCVCDWRRQL